MRGFTPRLTALWETANRRFPAGLRMLLILAFSVALCLPRSAPAAASSFAWPQWGFDEQHSGVNPQETMIGAGNVHVLKQIFRVRLGGASLPNPADGSPAYLGGVNVNGTTRDVLFLTTTDGWILALDAHTGRQIWGRQHGPGSCLIGAGFDANAACYTTSSPAIDPNRQYVYTYGLDGYVHKHNVATGEEITDAHWPELATRKPSVEKGSSALSTATDRNGASYLYMPGSGYLGDQGDYQGHLTAINLATGAQHVFNTQCSDLTDVHLAPAPATPNCAARQAAVWARPGVIHDPATDLIYVATGNGDFNPAKHYWGDSVLALHPDGTGISGNPVDSYTPADQETLDSTDADLGSSAPAVLPPIPNSAYPHLAVQAQKINRATQSAELRLINVDNLSQSGTRAPGNLGGDVGKRFPLPQGGFFLTQPAVWVNPADPGKPWVFVANDVGISGLQIYCDSGSTTPTLHLGWGPVHSGGTSPIVANGVLYYFGANGIQALRATDGIHLWSDTSSNAFHWESPIVADGTLYVPDNAGSLAAYALAPAAAPTVTFSVRRRGGRITFRWSVTRPTGLMGFTLYAGWTSVNQSVIRAHKSRTYRYVWRWPANKPLPRFSLRVMMNDGRQFSVLPQ